MVKFCIEFQIKLCLAFSDIAWIRRLHPNSTEYSIRTPQHDTVRPRGTQPHGTRTSLGHDFKKGSKIFTGHDFGT